jgi:hypothetical protein
MTLTIGSKTGVIVPNWTTGTRPSAPELGQQGWNSTLGQYEIWNGTTWYQITPPPA